MTCRCCCCKSRLCPHPDLQVPARTVGGVCSVRGAARGRLPCGVFANAVQPDAGCCGRRGGPPGPGSNHRRCPRCGGVCSRSGHVTHGSQLRSGHRCGGALRVQPSSQVVAAPPQRVALGGRGGGGVAGGALPGSSVDGSLSVPVRLRCCSLGRRQFCLQILRAGSRPSAISCQALSWRPLPKGSYPDCITAPPRV